jgi:hypothetical protein
MRLSFPVGNGQGNRFKLFISAGQTSTGRATIERLKINQPCMLEARHFRVMVGLHPPPLINR